MKRTVKPFLLALGCLFIFSLSQAAGGSVTKAKPKSGNGYKIHIKINGLKDTTMLLGHHFGGKKYVVDTIKLNSKGEGTFIGDTLLEGGIYLIITPAMNYFEVIVDQDQDFSLSTDTVDLIKNLKIVGSEENTVFNDYQNFMVENQKKAAAEKKKYDFFKKMVDSTGNPSLNKKAFQDSLAQKKAELAKLDTIVKNKWNYINTTYPTSLLASVLKAMKEVEVPPFPKNDKGQIIDSSFQYKYYRTHYFDNINFNDSRLLRTPILESKIDEYFDKVCYPPIPDTLCKEVDKVVNLSKGNYKMYRYVVQYLFNKYNNPKIMGMDRVFVYISDKYYLSGLATWAKSDTAFMKSIKDRVLHVRNNLIGEKAPELTLFDLQDKTVSLGSIESDYIVLYFFDTDCGHCQKIIPEWKKIYDEKKFASKGIKTVLVETQIDKKKMAEFAEKYGVKDLPMLYDPYQTTNFRVLYDIYSTPVPYILDKDKKIIAKRIEPTVIADFLEKMLEHDASLKNKEKK
jgi:peroxiredoxin